MTMSRRRPTARRLPKNFDHVAHWHGAVVPELRLRAEQVAVILGCKPSLSEAVNWWMKMHYDLALYAAGTEDDAQREEIHRRLAECEDSMMALLERMDRLEERRCQS